MKKDAIGSRMKENYENRYRIYLTRRTPVIFRLDGKAFHTLTKTCDKPYSLRFASTMNKTAEKLFREIQGAKCAYIQSDEISLLVTDFDRLDTDAWFDYNIQKMTSVSAGIASAYFTMWYGAFGVFDCRVFNIPKEEVNNYFVWRQQDWIRNSLNMLAQHFFSHKDLMGKKSPEIHDMLKTKKNINWADLDSRWKNGWLISSMLSAPAPIFTQAPEVIEQLLETEE